MPIRRRVDAWARWRARSSPCRKLERAVEPGGEVARIVGDGDPVLVGDPGPVGHLAGLHHVLPPHLDRIEAEAPRADVDEPLHHEDGFRPSRAAVGGVLRLVRHVARADAPVVGDAVRAGQVVHGVEREPRALDGIGADVRLERVLDRHDRAVPPEGDAGRVDLLAVVPRRGEVLAPALDPLDRAAEAQRDGRDEQLLVVDGALRPEPAAHVGREDAHLLGREPEGDGHDVAHEVRVLRGRPDDQVARLRIAEGEHPARLDRHGGDSRVAQLLLDDQIGGGEGPLGVADRAAHDDRGVVGPGRVDAMLGLAPPPPAS